MFRLLRWFSFTIASKASGTGCQDLIGARPMIEAQLAKLMEMPDPHNTVRGMHVQVLSSQSVIRPRKSVCPYISPPNPFATCALPSRQGGGGAFQSPCTEGCWVLVSGLAGFSGSAVSGKCGSRDAG